MSKYTIYGLHLSTDPEIRYVGRTSRPVGERLRRHVRDTNAGSTYPVHVWMRDVGVGNVQQIVLEVTTEDGATREAAWVSDLVASGNRMTNVFDPIDSPAGPWTEEQRASHQGENNPFFGRKHSEETRAKMRASAPRTSGPDHHLSGVKQDPEHVRRRVAKSAKARWTPEAREEQRQKMLANNPLANFRGSGEDNPFFGKTHSEDTRARMAESARNRPPISEETRAKMRLRNHNRWHVNRGLVNPDCTFC